MNHGHYGVYNKHTTLVLSHWKFAVDKPLALRARGLSMANSSDLGLGLYICCIHLIAVLYILHIHISPIKCRTYNFHVVKKSAVTEGSIHTCHTRTHGN